MKRVLYCKDRSHRKNQRNRPREPGRACGVTSLAAAPGSGRVANSSRIRGTQTSAPFPAACRRRSRLSAGLGTAPYGVQNPCFYLCVLCVLCGSRFSCFRGSRFFVLSALAGIQPTRRFLTHPCSTTKYYQRIKIKRFFRTWCGKMALRFASRNACRTRQRDLTASGPLGDHFT